MKLSYFDYVRRHCALSSHFIPAIINYVAFSFIDIHQDVVLNYSTKPKTLISSFEYCDHNRKKIKENRDDI